MASDQSWIGLGTNSSSFVLAQVGTGGDLIGLGRVWKTGRQIFKLAGHKHAEKVEFFGDPQEIIEAGAFDLGLGRLVSTETERLGRLTATAVYSELAMAFGGEWKTENGFSGFFDLYGPL